MKKHIRHGIKMVLVLAFIGFVVWAIRLDCGNQAHGQIEESATGLSNQSVKGNHVDSTSEDFVFQDGFRGTSVTEDSMFMTKKYIDDAAAGLTAQSVKGDHVDSTSEDFVFNDAFRITSAQAESILITKNHIEKIIEDSLDEYLPLAGGTMTGNITMPDDSWIGIASDKERIVFDDNLGEIEINAVEVGINTTSPALTLDITGDTGDTSQIRLRYAGGGYTYLGTNANADLVIFGTGDEVIIHENLIMDGNIDMEDNDIIDIERVEADTVEVSGDLIEDFAGTGLSVSSNKLVADLGTAIVTGEITDQTIVKADIDTTSTFVFGAAFHKTSAVADSEYMTKDYIDNVAATTLTEEEVEDFVGGMLGGTETNITATYNDGDNDIDFVVAMQKDLVTTAPVTGAADDVFIGADADITVALDFTASWDFGGAAGLEIPAVDDPTTDAEGEIAWDANDDAFEVFMGDEGESALIPGYQKIDALIFAPDGVNDEIAIMHVDALLYPFGIEIDQVSITLNADAAYSMVFEEWAGDPPVAQNDIETVTTGAGDAYMEVGGGDVDDAAIDADDYIYLHVPSTDIDWVHVQIIFHVNDGN